MRNKKPITNKMDSPFAKYRSAIWINICSLLIILIFIIACNSFVVTIFTSYKTQSWIMLCFFVMFYNFGFVSMYKLSKQVVLFNLLSISLILIAMIFISIFVAYENTTIKLIFLIGWMFSLIPLSISTFLAFVRAKNVYKYIGFKETLYNLEKRNFLKNNEPIKIKLFLKKGHFYIEENNIRRKFPSTGLNELEFTPASIFGKTGSIKFNINEDRYEYNYSSSFEDVIMFSLAYNIVRVNQNAIERDE